jgi:hypothetical protein
MFTDMRAMLSQSVVAHRVTQKHRLRDSEPDTCASLMSSGGSTQLEIFTSRQLFQSSMSIQACGN